jgi:hypothetical protein
LRFDISEAEASQEYFLLSERRFLRSKVMIVKLRAQGPAHQTRVFLSSVCAVFGVFPLVTGNPRAVNGLLAVAGICALARCFSEQISVDDSEIKIVDLFSDHPNPGSFDGLSRTRRTSLWSAAIRSHQIQLGRWSQNFFQCCNYENLRALESEP